MRMTQTLTPQDMRGAMPATDTVTSRTVGSRGADASPDHTPRLHQIYYEFSDAVIEARHMTSAEVERQASARSLNALQMLLCAVALAFAGGIGAAIAGKGIANLAHFNVNFSTQN